MRKSNGTRSHHGRSGQWSRCSSKHAVAFAAEHKSAVRSVRCACPGPVKLAQQAMRSVHEANGALGTKARPPNQQKTSIPSKVVLRNNVFPMATLLFCTDECLVTLPHPHSEDTQRLRMDICVGRLATKLDLIGQSSVGRV